MANQQLADDLREARKVIERPESWTKGQYAKMASGRKAHSPLMQQAVCFCAVGAVCKAVGEVDECLPRSRRLTDFLREFVPENKRASLRGIVAYNDRKSTTHADILNLFDRAIAAAEA